MFSAREPSASYFAVAIILCTLPSFGSWWTTIVLSVLILVFGLPHGAYDVFILRERTGPDSFFKAMACYVLAGGCVALVWWLAPAAFGLLFFGLSIIHFGDSDWPNDSWLVKLCWGVAVLAIPLAVQPNEVTSLLANLLPAPTANWIVNGIIAVGLPGLLGLFLSCANPIRKGLVLALLACVSWRQSALMGFAVYFCLFHSQIHLARWQKRIPVTDNHLARLLVLVVLMSVGVAVGTLMAVNSQSGLDSNLFAVTLLVLACLTAPHMVTVAMANRRNRWS